MTPQETAARLIACLRAQANPANVAGMARYGINDWALRQVGKRNSRLRARAMEAAAEIAAQRSPAARWIASDVLRELRARAASQ